MKIYNKIVVAVFCFISHSALAQQPCISDDIFHKNALIHPEILQTEQFLEKEIKEQLNAIELNRYAKTTADTVFYDVPIVVHIVHDFGTEYVTDDAVYNAFTNWSDAFLAKNADTADVIAPFKPYIGNARIRLRLATKDPNGNPTKGITRNRSYLTINAGDQAKLESWPNNRYINIWFVNKFSADHSGAAAYAYYPSSGAWMPYYDGVIALASYLDNGKTIPHELGHVLNLQHVWGNTNAPDVACGDDQVADTPPTKGHLPSGCAPAAIYDTTCATGYVVTSGSGIINYPDTTNAQNIMDYTYCHRMFTKGQVTRMRAALTSNVAGRNNLYTASNLSSTGSLSPMLDLPPVAAYSMEKSAFASERSYFLCANSSTKFVFRNRSWNDTITDVEWTFSNQAEVTSTNNLSFVNNQFKQPGWVTLTIKATGNNSGSTTLINTKAVYVADTNMIQPAGYWQYFASTTDHDNWPSFNYYENNFKWEWYQGVGVGDNACMRYRSYDYRSSPENMSGTPEGDYDDMVTPGFDVSGYNGSNLNLNFYTTGAYRGSTFATDSMQIMVSTDCGRIWKRIASLTGNNLASVSAASEYIPNANTVWKPQTIVVPANLLTNKKLFFKFRYFPTEKGNNLYFDKFSLTPFTTEVNEVATKEIAVKIYPNPTSDQVSVAFQSGIDGKVAIRITDLMGNIVAQNENQETPQTLIVKQIGLANLSNGMYFINVNVSGKSYVEKLILSR